MKQERTGISAQTVKTGQMHGAELENRIEEVRASAQRGRSKETEQLVAQALADGAPAEAILRLGLLPAMETAGNAFGVEESQADIPRLLSVARSVQKGLDVLEPKLENLRDRHIGKAILGTVEGDLHEVGKNLVAIMLRGVGLEVIDLGVDVSEKQFLRAMKEHPDASLLCISSLLTTTQQQMRRIVSAVRSADREGRVKIMVGGGSVTRGFARLIGADAYTENAADAARLARQLVLQPRGEDDETGNGPATGEGMP